MIVAGSAEAVFPGIPGKPGKLIGWGAAIDAPWRLREAADFVDNPGWVEKGVQVCTVDGNLTVHAGNY